MPQSVSNEQEADERRKHQLQHFYQKVVAQAVKSDEVFIFGSGDVKLELAKEMEKAKGWHAGLATVESCDELTENQIVVKVKSFFKAS